MNLYEKMFAVMNESEAVEKTMTVGSGKNAYKAVSEAAMLNMVKPLLKKHKLIIFPIDGTIQDHTMVWDKTNFDGKTEKSLRAMTELKVTYRIMDTESKEFQDVVGFGNGSDPQDKGAGKAFTYSLKNALSKSFMLFSGEDTDNEHSDDIGRKPQNDQQKSKPVGNDNHVPKPQEAAKNDSAPSNIEKRASKIYFTMTGTKEGQHGWPLDQYKQWLKDFKEAGAISTGYGKNWTLKDIEYLESQIQELPF